MSGLDALADVSGQLVPRFLPPIPDTLRGRTLVRDSISFVYAVDRMPDGTSPPGAPADGLRFVLSRLRVLISLPDAEAVWQEGMADLIVLQFAASRF